MYPAQILEGLQARQLDRYWGPERPLAAVRGVGTSGLGFDDVTLGKHTLFLGSIGSGKTVGMSALVGSLRQGLGPEDVLVFFDSKGDYIEQFHRPGDVTLSASPSSSFPNERRWNLFDELTDVPPERLPETVGELTASLVADLEGPRASNNRIWTNMAQDLLAALIIVYVRSGNRYTNRDIRAMSDKLTAAQMRSFIEPHVDLRGTLQYIAKDDSNTTVSVMIFLQQAIRQVFSSTFREAGDFSVRGFLKQRGGRALFLEYDVSLGTTLGPVFRTLIDIALKESLGRNRTPGRVVMVLDEFALLPPLRHMDAGLNFGRSLGMRFVVGTQNVGQIRETYGEGLANSILGGFGTVFAFRLFDQLSRDYIAQRFGRNRKLVRYDAALKTRGIGEQLIDGQVIEDWDLTGLGVGQSIVGLPVGPPLQFTFAAPAAGS
ncbi:MAG: type IV secretion system DNA-binding domain-containing protein [Micropruina sp.]|uniref:type IV secretory system conjugative DNA transfer family protein n=1 Tax=Micropruina sp. TaxID=2737536 RepID=UPI0039E7183B